MPNQSQSAKASGPPMRQLKFRTPESFYQRLRQESKRQGRTMQALLVESLEHGLFLWGRARP